MSPAGSMLHRISPIYVNIKSFYRIENPIILEYLS